MPHSVSTEKRNYVLEAALELFVARGVAAASTYEIAKAAHIATGTLILYYPTKQALVDALVLQISQRQSDFIQSRLTPQLSVREAFFAIWEGSLRWFLDNPQAFRYIQQVRDSHHISQEVVEETARNLQYYYTAIQRGLEEGLIQPYPVDLIGGMLYQQVIAVMNLLLSQPDESQHEALIGMGFEIFWNGIRKDNVL